MVDVEKPLDESDSNKYSPFGFVPDPLHKSSTLTSWQLPNAPGAINVVGDAGVVETDTMTFVARLVPRQLANTGRNGPAPIKSEAAATMNESDLNFFMTPPI